ncbi:MAG TPA: hypothetical protein PKD64_10155 [Pirellulaceae bacterium]|nr:hypothetical protein [Pirellulaceae bacterium]HMO92543.1 hypothetical protein [Pirellulaceae bacterium]HMP68975.1 hypothetical protein [Pirellulaceae bacterium]
MLNEMVSWSRQLLFRATVFTAALGCCLPPSSISGWICESSERETRVEELVGENNSLPSSLNYIEVGWCESSSAGCDTCWINGICFHCFPLNPGPDAANHSRAPPSQIVA